MSYTLWHTHTSGWEPSFITASLKCPNGFPRTSECFPASISTNCYPFPQGSDPTELLGPTALSWDRRCEPPFVLRMQDLDWEQIWRWELTARGGPWPWRVTRRSSVSAQPASHPRFRWSAFPRFFPCLRRSPVLWDQYSALWGKLPSRENALFFPERSLETRPSRSLWVSKVVSGKSWLDSRHTLRVSQELLAPALATLCKHWSLAGVLAAPLIPGFLVKPSSST